MLLIGGGPSALGIFINAFKTNRFCELVTQGMGVAIVDAGTNFGGGRLGDYGINSNTSSKKFLECTYKTKKKLAVEEK